MRAYQLESFGSVEGIVLHEQPEPEPGPTDIVVRVHAASINRRDLMILEQTYPLTRLRLRPTSDMGAVATLAAVVVEL